MSLSDARERFKAVFADTVEALCIAEARVEQLQAEVADLRAKLESTTPPSQEGEKP